ncbi:MAG TPA: type II toxin-antitoxin system PemK/MazF family toxin [Fimbriimonadaceae bacterium]|jgi:mRNA interferase MazF
MAADPRRGEIWLVELDPTRGSEVQKTRPVVVVSSNAINGLPIRMVAPVTSFQERHLKRIWAVPIEATDGTGLEGKSTIMPEQSRCVSLERFVGLKGSAPPFILDELDAALKIVLDLN